jgi:hypothetical protein
VQAFIFFSCLGGLLVLIWLLALISNNLGEQSTATADPNKQDQKGKLDADMVLWTRAVARYTKALAFVGVVSAAIAFGTLWAIKGQLDVMENDKRPWLNAVVSLDKFIEITEWNGSRGINVPLKFAIKNYGQEPAVNVRVNSTAWPHPGNPRRGEILIYQKQVCERGIEAADKDPIGGTAIFPSETTIADGVGNLSGGNIYKDGAPVLWAIFGCIDYTYGNRRHGQTGFNFLLGKAIDGQVFGIPFVEGAPISLPAPEAAVIAGFPKDPPKWAKIPASEVWFMPAHSGNYAK